jgi:alpha-L-rhamnosidase
MTVPTPPASWGAVWIEPDEPTDGRDVHRPGYHLVGELELSDAPTRAVLHITARGLYEAFLNGTRIGDVELTPGFTAYRSRLQVHSFDVTDLVQPGGNALGVLLTDGWWRGQTTVARKTNRYGDTVAVLAELHVTGSDGRTEVLRTDGSWRWTTGHVVAADLIAGEHHDLRLRVDAWADRGTDRSAWSPVRVAEHGTEILTPPLGPPVRRIEQLAAIDVREVAPGRHIVDFGRVSNGWIRLSDLGPAGTTLTIEHAEALTPDGTDVQNDCHATFLTERRSVPFQTDRVVSTGDGSVFEPRHSTKGFRYLRIDGHPGPLAASALTSVVVRNELERVGTFACSDDDLNRLHEAAEWSLLTNCCDIPTDCPTRERAGWTGDWQIFVATAAYLRDVTDFSLKWLLDVAADQLDNGAICNFVPEPADFTDPAVGWWKAAQGSAGWGDAIVHVPWQLYLATGRTDVLEVCYPAMTRWVDFAATSAASGRHPERAAARPTPAPHVQSVWDTGFHFGEWNEPGAEEGQIERIKVMDHGPTATAYLFRSAHELSRIAEVLGDTASADRFASLAGQVRNAWQREFVDEQGAVTPATQANLVRALAFGLITEQHRARATEDLVALVRAAGTHLGTGFLATPFLLPTLADNGHADLAYELLLQRTYPSWLGMLDAGATTIWEGWDSVKPDGTVTSSLNHFSMGAVISYLHRYVAGLRVLEPGYRRFRVQPVPGGGITRASTAHTCPFGEIAVAWTIEADKGTLRLTVPAGTGAEVLLPDGARHDLGPGEHTAYWDAAEARPIA